MTRHLSITRLRLRSLRFAPEFLFRTLASQRQIKRSDGFIEGYVAQGPGLTFWTVTSWTSTDAMRGFRGAGAHRAALPKLALWCDEAATASLADDRFPDPADAARLLVEYGRIFKVRYPSAAQERGEAWPDGQLPSAGPHLQPVKAR